MLKWGLFLNRILIQRELGLLFNLISFWRELGPLFVRMGIPRTGSLLHLNVVRYGENGEQSLSRSVHDEIWESFQAIIVSVARYRYLLHPCLGSARKWFFFSTTVSVPRPLGQLLVTLRQMR